MSIVYQVRSGALSGFLPLVGSLQGDADGLLTEVDLDREVLANPDRLIGIEQLASLLDNCAKRLDCPDFGLRLAGYQGIDMLGVRGKSWRRACQPISPQKAMKIRMPRPLLIMGSNGSQASMAQSSRTSRMTIPALMSSQREGGVGGTADVCITFSRLIYGCFCVAEITSVHLFETGCIPQNQSPAGLACLGCFPCVGRFAV